MANEQQASSLHPSVRRDGHTATPSLTQAGSSFHARRACTDAQAALLMARELLRYRPVDDLYEDWLDRIAELVSTAGGSPAPSLSLPHPPPAAGDMAHGAPLPPPQQDGALALRRVAQGAPQPPPRQGGGIAARCAVQRRDPPRHMPAHEERSCQEILHPQGSAPPLLAPLR